LAAVKVRGGAISVETNKKRTFKKKKKTMGKGGLGRTIWKKGLMGVFAKAISKKRFQFDKGLRRYRGKI